MIEMSISTKNANENSYYIELDLVDSIWSDSIKIPGGDINYIVYAVEVEEEDSIVSMQASLNESETDATWIDFIEGELNPAINLFRVKVDGGAGKLLFRCQ